MITKLGWILILPSLILIAFETFQDTANKIKYLTEFTIPFDELDEFLDTVTISDTQSANTLYQVNSKEGYPLFYFQQVTDDVCFDSKCRPIDLTIYWNITGRYLGFLLENGEFLSRRDHDEFNADDYQTLHQLLADPHLPFSDLTFEELVNQQDSDYENVDGTSGATSKDIAAYVVDGAAYTTFLLWKNIYGPSQIAVQSATKKQLHPKLIWHILRSPSHIDQLWALRTIEPDEKLNPEIEKRILKLIEKEDFYVSLTAISILSEYHLRSEKLQHGLFSIYEKKPSGIRKPILEKLSEASSISPELISASYLILPKLNGTELDQWLTLYEKFDLTDSKMCKEIALIVDNPNIFIAKKAYDFLANAPCQGREIEKALKSFEVRNR